MKKIIIALTFLLSTPLMAAGSSLYGGISYGSSTFDTGITGLTGTASLDENGTGYKLFIGNKISKRLAFEAFYADFGEATIKGNNGDQFVLEGTTFEFLRNNATLAISATGFGINANFTHNFSDKSSIIGRLGLVSWNAKVSVSASDATGGSYTTSGSDVLYGIGYQYNFTKKVGLVIDYDMFTMEDLDIKTLSLGVNVKF